ncbi:MAG: hypothetical protein ACPGUU_10205, partial [Flavobacteriaceae bacterium]
PKRTKKKINFSRYENDAIEKLLISGTNIHEGTFGKFYPVRFELWFESFRTKKKMKLTEFQLLIDGWDR